MRLLPLVLVLVWSPVAAEPSEEELVASVTLAPRKPEAEFHAQLLLDKLNREGRFDELEQWVTRMLADRALLHRREELTQVLETLERHILHRRVQDAANAGDFETCIAVAERIRDREVGLHNAGVCAQRARQPLRAIGYFWRSESKGGRQRALQLLVWLPAFAYDLAIDRVHGGHGVGGVELDP